MATRWCSDRSLIVAQQRGSLPWRRCHAGPRSRDVANQRGQMAREGARCMSTWRLPRRGAHRHRPRPSRKDICPRPTSLSQICAPPIAFPRPRERLAPLFRPPPPCARSTKAKPSAAGSPPESGAVDRYQRGGGRQAVSSSVAHVYIGSSPVDSARLIVTHRESDCGQP